MPSGASSSSSVPARCLVPRPPTITALFVRSPYSLWPLPRAPFRPGASFLGPQPSLHSSSEAHATHVVATRHGRGSLLGLVGDDGLRSEEHTSELQSRENLVCR